MSPRFQWDYPSQGLRAARTLNEAFGPYATLSVERSGRVNSRHLYALSFVLAAASVIIAIV